MQRVVPAVRVRSYEKSRCFSENLGFTEQWNHQFETGLPVFASIVRDEMENFLAEHSGDCQFGRLVQFYVPDVDQCCAEFRERQVPVSQPPSDSLGDDIRDMSIVDPDGNRLSLLTRWC